MLNGNASVCEWASIFFWVCYLLSADGGGTITHHNVWVIKLYNTHTHMPATTLSLTEWYKCVCVGCWEADFLLILHRTKSESSFSHALVDISTNLPPTQSAGLSAKSVRSVGGWNGIRLFGWQDEWHQQECFYFWVDEVYIMVSLD